MQSVWVPNSIPVPATRVAPEKGKEAEKEDDFFSKGEIAKFFPQQSYGFVKDRLGRELFFHVDEIDLLGTRNRREHIQVGAKVGYDCCRTPHGLRVKRMKIY